MPADATPPIEPVRDDPEYLALGAWQAAPGGLAFEVVSRRKLDTRQVVPYFVHGGAVHVGVLERTRAARAVRGAPSLAGLEAIGFDFAGVDETADIAAYSDALFTARSGVAVDPALPVVPLPAYARSIGYLSELALPLLVGIRPPPSDTRAVSWDGGTHALRFRPASNVLAELLAPSAPPHAEDLLIMLRAIDPRGAASVLPPPGFAPPDPSRAAAVTALLARARAWTAAELAAFVERDAEARGFTRLPDPRGEALRFLRLHRVTLDGHRFEVVTPASGVSVAMLPYLVAPDGTAHFVLWRETRVAALERVARQPLYDTPISAQYVNATACFLTPHEARSLAAGAPVEALVPALLGRAMERPGPLAVRSATPLGASPAEPAPGVSSEVRYSVLCELDPLALSELPGEAFTITAPELARAVADGCVRDPVVVAALLTAAPALGLDPFAPAREAPAAARASFVATMTRGSVVQRRLRSYSSIEVEQLGAPTYARLMTLLQHEYGVRVAYPQREQDRSFFKAAFRVFMAADREENRALQGLHWSHDAFHFALGNFTTAPATDLADWYDSGAPAPAASPPEGPAWDQYAAALKAAEDEATFFSFWTLYHEQPSLARHVGKLTYHAALRDMGITDRPTARAIFDDVTARATIPAAVTEHPVYRARDEVRSLFEYMRGFRDYHLGDIRAAYKHASRDPYRGVFLRFGVYDHDLARYLAQVRGFQSRLDAYPAGLNPLLAACADVRVALCLRVWDVVKALKLVRAAIDDAEGLGPGAQRARRREWREECEAFFTRLEQLAARLAHVRAGVTNAELVPRNEAVYAAIGALAREIEQLRGELWDRAASTGLLSEAVLAEERARELPR